jgi:hypothetical protein
LCGSETITGSNKSTFGAGSRVEVVGSNPADPTTSRTDPAAAKVFRTLWEPKKGGQSEDTLRAKGDRLRFLGT